MFVFPVETIARRVEKTSVNSHVVVWPERLSRPHTNLLANRRLTVRDRRAMLIHDTRGHAQNKHSLEFYVCTLGTVSQQVPVFAKALPGKLAALSLLPDDTPRPATWRRLGP